jgi:dihydroorotase
MPLIITPRDPLLAVNGCAHAGSVATRLGLPSIPVAAETVALASLLELARNIPCRLHVSRLSSARAVNMVNDAKQAGLPVTADVGMHHLFFTDQQLAGFDVNFHSAVPFRSEADRKALRSGLADNTIDAICSDHAPHDADAKLAPFPGSEPGLSAFDSFVPLLLALPELLGISLAAVIAKVTTGPAGVIGSRVDTASPNNSRPVPSGRRAAAETADIVLLDPASTLSLDEDSVLSLGKNTPLLGVSNLRDCTGEAIALRGRVHTAIVNGAVRYASQGAAPRAL